jgi:hypothetical protein
MQKIIIFLATVIAVGFIGFGLYYYHVHYKQQPEFPQPEVCARMVCSPQSEFGFLTQFEPDIKLLINAIKGNQLLDSIYNGMEFIVEWHLNKNNNKKIPVIWFAQTNLEARLKREFPQKISDNQIVNEIMGDSQQRIFYRIFPGFVLFSVSAEILEKIPLNLVPPSFENYFTKSPTAFKTELSGSVLHSLDGIQTLLPSFSSFYLSVDSISGVLNTDNDNVLFRFCASLDKDNIDIWNHAAATSSNYAQYIPKEVSSFDAFIFADYSLFFSRMKTIPEKKAVMEKYSTQYQLASSDTLARFIGNWIWTAKLDITERGEYAPIAGIHIADTTKTGQFLNSVCTFLPNEQLKLPNSKEMVRIQKLVTGNFFEHIFPSEALQSDTVFVLFHRNHLWLATSPKILRYVWGTFINKLTIQESLGMNRASYYHYKNVKKMRAALSSTDNSQQAMFLRSFYQNQSQSEHCLLELDFSITPYSGTLRIW